MVNGGSEHNSVNSAAYLVFSNTKIISCYSTLAQNTDISYYGGSLAVINGDSEHNPVNSTASLSQIYQQMKTNQQGEYNHDVLQ